MTTTITTKPTSIQRFFDELAMRDTEPLLHHVSGTIEWNIRNAGRWWLRINQGSLHVSQSPQDTQTIASCDADTFASVINGEENLMAAALRGVIRVSGNLALALSFQRLLP